MPPAARIGDMHVCPMVNPGPVPHVGGPITVGAPTVLIGGMPAARQGDMCTCVGPPDAIAMGSATVQICGMPAARLGDPTVHGGSITVGFPTVMIGLVGMGGASTPQAMAMEQAKKNAMPFVEKCPFAPPNEPPKPDSQNEAAETESSEADATIATTENNEANQSLAEAGSGKGETGSLLDDFSGSVSFGEHDAWSGKSAFSPGVGVQYGKEGAIFGDPSEDGFSFFGGEIAGGAGIGEDGVTAGLSGEAYMAKGKVDGVLGDEQLGVTGGLEGKAMAIDGFAGIKDNSIGASVGGTLASVKGDVGANVAGVNVGVNAEVGIKAELGFKVGQHTEVKLPFVTVGFSFGKAKSE